MLVIITIIIVFVVFIVVQCSLFKIYGVWNVDSDWGIGLFYLFLDNSDLLNYIVVVSFFKGI